MDKRQEILRKYVAAALCDFLAYITSIKEPIIVGGQYPRNKMIETFRQWCFDRKINMGEITDEDAKLWLHSCQQGKMTGPTGIIPSPPKVKESPPDFEPVDDIDDVDDDSDDSDEEEKGYFEGDEWKSKEDKKERWQDEGENWKKGESDEQPA